MSAIRQSVKVFNRRGIFHVTRTRAFCSGGMKTDEVQEKDLFITKVHSDDIQVFRTGVSNAKYYDLIKPSIATTGRGDSLHGGLHGGDQDAGGQGGEARRQPSRRRLSRPLLSRSQPTRPLCQGTVDGYLATYILCFMAVYSYIQGSDFVPFLMYAGYQIRQLRSLRGADSAERVRGHGLGRRKQRARSDRRRILVSWLRG